MGYPTTITTLLTTNKRRAYLLGVFIFMFNVQFMFTLTLLFEYRYALDGCYAHADAAYYARGVYYQFL